MDGTVIACRDPSRLGRSLRAWRALRRVKQTHAAELLGVSQATLSRWEGGRLAPDAAEQAALRRLMAARLDGAAERELARLVRNAATAVHLVCDLTHRLLALSPARERELRVPAAELMGTSLWPHATAEIVAAEARLGDLGWFEPGAPAVEAATGPNRSPHLLIPPGRFRWVRFPLSCGGHARLVETLPG